MSSIIFSACNDGWKGLKISCDTEEIMLVLDDDELSRADVVFEMSGSNNWSEIDVRSEPQGLVMVEKVVVKDKQCGVQIKAIQPSGDGAKLIFTHLGANISCSVPLKVGRKLVDVQSAHNDYVIQPQIEDDDEAGEYEIPAKSLIVGVPENYTNSIAWNIADGQEMPAGVELKSYNSKGEEVENAFTYDGDSTGNRLTGVSSAIKTVVRVTKDFYGTEKIMLNPVSILDGKAVLYKDVTISVYILNLDTDRICVSSDTHQDDEGNLGDVVIINNPSKLRGDEGNTLYNYYSTAILNLRFNDAETQTLKPIPQDYRNLYTIQTSTDITNLSVEQVGYESIRLTALNLCAGEGSVKIKFVPNKVVGDIQAFEIDVPVICGERATGVFATKAGETITVSQSNGIFASTAVLNDTYSAGEGFKFKMLSENTLNGLKKFKIRIDKKLLYISDKDIQNGYSNYIKETDRITWYDLTGHQGYKYQICLKNGNRQMVFYSVDGQDDVFESEWLTENNTIYIKYEATNNELEATNFGITINNVYDERYNIANNGFADTCITYNLTFSRQRTVEDVSYRPAKFSKGEGGGVDFDIAQGYANDWTYYFTRDMLASTEEFYGVDIADVFGVGGAELDENEKNGIDLTISVVGGNGNLGLARWDEYETSNGFSQTTSFTFKTNGTYPNLFIFGKTDNNELEYGEYTLIIKQGVRELKRNTIKIYKQLEETDVKITIPSADYSGIDYLNAGELDADEDKGLKKLNSSYILSIDNNYKVDIKISNTTLVEAPSFKSTYSIVDANGETGLRASSFITYDDERFNISTLQGLFDAENGKKNFVKINYAITVPLYDYFKAMTDAGGKPVTEVIDRAIYIYIYEPVQSAKFIDENGDFKTNIVKYNFTDLQYTPYADTECYQELSIYLNNGSSASVFNYIDIKWKVSGDGILNYESLSVSKARYKFGWEQQVDGAIRGTIVATISQFGLSIPIYCGYVVQQPVLTDKVTITNNMSNFNSGLSYINLKKGESLQIEASASSKTEKEVSLVGFDYAICGVNGYQTGGVATVNSQGLVTAENAGRVKLVVVAKDRLKKDLGEVINFFKFTQYVDSSAYAIVDIIVTDGSLEHPYLISTGKDFENIANDFVDGKNDNFYALVGDINLNGKEINFDGVFTGGIFSYQEDKGDNARYSIYGVRITSNNKCLFEQIAREDGDEHCNLENIDVHITFDFEMLQASRQTQTAINLGFIGTNKGYIKDCQFYVGGWIDGGDIDANYVIGTIASDNQGAIEIADEELVGVQGSITVQGTIQSTVLLGGLVGKNSGSIKGVIANNIWSDDENVDYTVFYDSQGCMADVELQVKSVDVTRYDESAIGGVVGENRGTIFGVYSSGKILGLDDRKQLVVNNVGGIAGKNLNNKFVYNMETSNKKNNAILGIGTEGGGIAYVESVQYTGNDWQVESSYSTAIVYGRNNVGGVVGYDENGEYKNVYYEIYDNSLAYVKGNSNVGGLIGYGKDTSLYYCYSNCFAWDYTSGVSVYNIEAENNAGGLIGYGKSGLSSYTAGTHIQGLFVVSCASSVLIYSNGLASGIIGYSNGYSAIYTAYFYGVIEAQEMQYVAKLTSGEVVRANRPYNNVYVILGDNAGYNVDTLSNKNFADTSNKFGQSEEYNNGKPYIKYNGGNLVSAVPTIIEINASFEGYDDTSIKGYENKNKLYKVNILGEYVLDNGEYKEYTSEYEGRTRYALMGELQDNITYKEDASGGYVLDEGVYREYNKDTDSGKTRYTKVEDGNNSDYRSKVFALYYYDFKLLDSDTAILDMQSLNSISIRSLLLDGGIVSRPKSRLRFGVSSSNRSVVNPTSNGTLVIKGEGQATITITSMLNKNASASFVVIVRSKTLEFGLYSSANCLEEYDINGTTLSVVKNTSKLIYANYSTVVTRGVNKYEYSAPTNMEVHFTIEVVPDDGKTEAEVLGEGKTIENYITINGNVVNGEYIVEYGVPITITVNEFLKEGKFKITAQAYIILDYTSDLTDAKNTIKIPLAEYFKKEFYVITKKGVSAINLNATKIDIMPADKMVLSVKINTDIKVDTIDFDLTSLGEVFEFEIGGEKVKTPELLEVYYNDVKQTGTMDTSYNDVKQTGTIDISGAEFDEEKQEIVFELTLKISSKGYYLDEEYKLDLRFKSGTTSETIRIDVKPQEISNIMMLNYRMGENVDDLTQASLSNIIRPGSRNVLVINIAPNIAVYDYLEIVDLNDNDKVLFMQQTIGTDGKLKPMPNMDKWVDGGVKLIKETETTSTIYTYAMLPLMATANETHTIRVTAYDKAGKILVYRDVSLEAVLFPSVTLTYTYPNGQDVVADSRSAYTNDYTEDADLAVGVEAGIKVETSNIDEDSLEYEVNVKKDATNYNDYVTFRYEQDGYMLRFNTSKSEADLRGLVGGTISISFSASKQINGVVETCKSTIRFTIREYVIHSVSMMSIAPNGKMYGFYDDPNDANKREKIETEFYFDKTDISYWTGSSYWNVQYKLDNLVNPSGVVEAKLKEILQELNTLGAGNITIKFGEKSKFDSAETLTSSGYDKDGITIKNNNNKLQITATEKSKINDMKISVEFGLKFDKDNYHILADKSDRASIVSKAYEFYVEKRYNPFEEYKTVSSQAEFEAMLAGNYYQLTNDITLDNYSPISTAISAFTGNGYTITIKNFNIDQLKQDYSSGDINIGLFGTVGEQTVIQNVVVNYSNSSALSYSVRIDFEEYEVKENTTLNNINIGGIAGTNLGVITNCNIVGKLDTYAPQIPATQIFIGGVAGINGSSNETIPATITRSTVEINLSGMAMIGGVAEYNCGKISTTVFKGSISSNEKSEYASSIHTAGFVVENASNAIIALSAVLSGEKYDYDLYSVGSLAGFVLSNSGSVTDCYATDMSMLAQGKIGGFVYENDGSLTRCYANPNLEASRFYERFIYNTASYGDLEYCYVITDEVKELNIEGLSKISKNNVADKSKFDGFTFATTSYGVWCVKNSRISLNNIGYTQLTLAECKNVLNIYDDVTFEGYLTQNLVDNAIQGKTFNIVRDIDLSNLSDNPDTYDKIFSAGLEGNGMAISGYNIYNSGNVEQIGLFASIRQNSNNNVFVRNLILQPASIKASKSAMVGALAGVIYGGYLYNIEIDGEDVLILGKNAVGGLAGIIKGDFEILDIQSNISVFATYTYGIGGQYNLYLSKNSGGTSYSNNNVADVSYAGSVAGIVDGYKNGTQSMQSRATANRSIINNVKVNGDIIVIGETVGGAFGLVAEETKVSNIKYSLDGASRYQSVYVSGGLVGENRGIIENSYIYNPTPNECFSGFGRLIGGIVGLNVGGLVEACSSNIYISTSTDLATIGGIVGRNIEGSVNNCAIDGKLNAYFVGGIIGTEYSYSLINSTGGVYGVPTTATKQKVLANVRMGVAYSGVDGKYTQNKIGSALIQNLMDTQTLYYTYNSLYNGEDVNDLILANSIFGLIVGLTDRDMSVDMSTGNEVKYEDGYLIANLKASGVTTKKRYELSKGNITELDGEEEGKVIISAIELFENTTFDFSQSQKSFTFLYLIAGENATYEYWSSVLGYSDEFIILS